METSIERAGRGEPGPGPAVTALNGEQPGGLTGRAGLPPTAGGEARYERLAVTHSTTISQLPTLSIGFIDKLQHRNLYRRNPLVAAARPTPPPRAPARHHLPARHSARARHQLLASGIIQAIKRTFITSVTPATEHKA
jgi:hypothetical protein